MNILRLAGLAWADSVMEGTFFIMQLYLTNVWKMSFTNAAGFLNIWGGIYRILPIFFLFLADTFFGNFITLTFSAISNTTGAVLITVATAPVFGHSVSGGACEEKGEGVSCVGHTEKVLFITGMALIALGRAAHIAAVEPFMDDQTITNDDPDSEKPFRLIIASIIFSITPLVVIIAFPYVKRWYVLFGVSAVCTAMATLFYLSGIHTYNRCGPNKNGSPITDIFRVIVAAALKRSQPSTSQENIQLYRTNDQEEFQDLSASRTLRFLHKAAIKLPGDDDDDDDAASEVKKSWKLCSVSQVESAKTIIRMFPMWCAFIMCGVVSSAGNTYFVEQASHLNTKLGSWKLPIQFILLGFVLSKYMIAPFISWTVAFGKYTAMGGGGLGIMFSVLCCTAAAAVERRRLHVVRGHHLLDSPDDSPIPMSIFWMYFQVSFLAYVDVFSQCGLSAFHLSETPESMKRYEDCFSEVITGFGFLCSALSVYVVGKISEAGDSNNWFQHSLNRSRLDRYYWVLSGLTAINLIAFALIVSNYSFKKKKKAVNEDDEFEKNAEQAGSELLGIKKSSALGIICTYIVKLMKSNPTHVSS